MAGFDVGKLQVGSAWQRPSDWTQADYVAANKAGYRYGNIGSGAPGSVSPTGPSGGFGAAIEDPRLRGKTPVSTGDGKGTGMGWFQMPSIGLKSGTMPPMPPPPAPKPPTTGTGGEDPGPTLDPVSVPIPPPQLPKSAMSGLAGAMSGPGFADIQRPPTDTASLGKRILPQNGMELTKRGKLWR